MNNSKWKLAFFGLLVLVAASAAGFVQHKGGIRWIEAKMAPKPAPAGDTLLSIYAAMPAKIGADVFLGDSHIAFLDWAEALSNPQVICRGKPGDTTDGVLGRLDEVLRHQPRSVHIMLGINDLFSGKSIESTLTNYKRIVERIRAEQPACRIVAYSVLPVNMAIYRTHPKKSQVRTADEIQEFNRGLQGLAVEYVDLWPVLVTDGQLRGEYTYDGIHLNGAGYMASVACVR